MSSPFNSRVADLAASFHEAQTPRDPTLTLTQCRLAILWSLASLIDDRLDELQDLSESMQRRLIEDYSPPRLEGFLDCDSSSLEDSMMLFTLYIGNEPPIILEGATLSEVLINNSISTRPDSVKVNGKKLGNESIKSAFRQACNVHSGVTKL